MALVHGNEVNFELVYGAVEGVAIKAPASARWQKIFRQRTFATCMDAHIGSDPQDKINAKLSAAAYSPRMAKASVCYEKSPSRLLR